MDAGGSDSKRNKGKIGCFKMVFLQAALIGLENPALELPPMRRPNGEIRDGSSIRRHIFTYCKTVEWDSRRASIMHLVDLKRAGHSPTQTEYTVTAEYAAAPRGYAYGGCLHWLPAMCKSF